MPRLSPSPTSFRSPLSKLPSLDAISAAVIRAQALFEVRRRALAATHLRPFTNLIFDDFVEGEWLLTLFEALAQFEDDILNRRSPRLMVFAPPRHGKSQVVSRALPSFLLGRHPRWEVVAASSTQDLADEFGLFTRNLLNSPLYRDIFPAAIPDPSSNATSHINILAGGSYRALSVGSTIVGRGAHALIIDDPIKGRSEAYSATEREKLLAWFRANARTRLAPGGGILVMHQRWHPEDLAASLLTRAAQDDQASQWKVLNFPAILPDGEALFPERWPLSLLRSLEADMTPAEWRAMYQQNPLREEGGFFQHDWFQSYSTLPESLTWYIGVDFASSKNSRRNRTAILPFGLDHRKNAYLAPDFVADHLDSIDGARALLTLARKYRVKGICTEKGTLQNVMEPVIRRVSADEFNGEQFTFIPVTRSDGKHIMAIPYQARLQARTVFFPSNRQVDRLLVPQHLNYIPEADNTDDDIIDAAANLFQKLPNLMAPRAPESPEPEDEQAREDARWEKILSNGGRARSSVPFTRLNGRPFEGAAPPTQSAIASALHQLR